MKREEILKEIKKNDVTTEIFHDAVFAYMKFMEDGEEFSDWRGISTGLEWALRRLLGFEITDFDSDTELHEAVKMQCQLQYYF